MVCIYVDRGQTNYVRGCDWTNRDCLMFATRGVGRLQHKRRPAEGQFYRFSAFWLRSSRNNCSLEFNSSNGGIAPKLLIQFLRIGTRKEACFARPTGCPGIAVPPGAAHSPFFWGTQVYHKYKDLFFNACYFFTKVIMKYMYCSEKNEDSLWTT